MNDLLEQLGNTDIYLIDQILKGQFTPGQKILDAGCGSGRNLRWFVKNNFTVYGIDRSEDAIREMCKLYPQNAANFTVCDIEALPYTANFFDYIISAAVLHFAENEQKFASMVDEMIRVLKPEGFLFIRMASKFATPHSFKHLKNGVYLLRDESERFLLCQNLLEGILNTQKVILAEPIKTTNVNELRCMTTLVFKKV